MPNIDFTFTNLGEVVKLIVAFLFAMPIAWEREHATRIMGLRTFPLVSLGSCAYILVGASFLVQGDDAWARLIQERNYHAVNRHWTRVPASDMWSLNRSFSAVRPVTILGAAASTPRAPSASLAATRAPSIWRAAPSARCCRISWRTKAWTTTPLPLKR